MKCVVLAYHNVGRAGIEALERNGFEISAIFTQSVGKYLVRFRRGTGR